MSHSFSYSLITFCFLPTFWISFTFMLNLITSFSRGLCEKDSSAFLIVPDFTAELEALTRLLFSFIGVEVIGTFLLT